MTQNRTPLEGKFTYRHEAEYRGHGIVAIYSYGPADEHTALVREAAKVMRSEYGTRSAVSSGGISGWLGEAKGGSADTRVCETQTIFHAERQPHDYTCQVCAKTTTLEISKAHLAEWKAGAFIQSVMPYLSADERELVKTAICGTCFDVIMGPEDDDE
jgi:hypothetical protein